MGKIETSLAGFQDNDVDAFRHAYVSGVFTQEYNTKAAEIFGRMNEWTPFDVYSNSVNPGSKNMDLWNNAVGRKYGAETKDRESLLKSIHRALRNGELIVDPKDKRQYEGASIDSKMESKGVIVLNEDETGRNELFYDLSREKIFTVDEFVVLIEGGLYSEYTVKVIQGRPTPVSKPDGEGSNNLG